MNDHCFVVGELTWRVTDLALNILHGLVSVVHLGWQCVAETITVYSRIEMQKE
jgi:hypothetical protein